MTRYFIGFMLSVGLFIGTGAVLSPINHLACMMPIRAQGIPSPPEGNPGHAEPAPGSNCVHNKDNPDHNCACHRTCEHRDDGGIEVKEDPKCRSFCYRDHCSCPIECEGV